MSDLDARPLSALQIRVFVLCALIVLLDGYDLQAMGLAVPTLAQDWHLSNPTFKYALSASLIGLGLGSAFIAPWGDRLGRRPLLLGGLAIILVTSLGVTTATTPWQLSAWRLLIGLGLGVCQSNASALTAEYAPLARRATIMTLMGVCVSFGAMLAGLTAPQVLAAAGWRGLFLVGAALPFLALLASLAALPESPALVAKRGAPAAAGGTLLALLRAPYLERTLRLWLVYGLSAMLFYFLISWLPTFLIAAGWSHSQAPHGIALGAIFYPPAIRVTGFGWAGAVSRIGAVLGPLAGGWIIAAGLGPRLTLGLVALPALLCIAGTLAMRRSVADIIQPTTPPAHSPEIP